MISVEDLTFSVDGRPLVDHVSFGLARGEVLAVLGPNGAGKSTLLKCLSGEHRPSRGSIRVGDRPLNSWSLRDAARWRGVLPQSGRVPFAFRAMEIVLLGRSPHTSGIESAEDIRIAREALAMADATHLADRTVNTLSGGELQRVHTARVLAQIWEPVENPGRLLLLDEPTASLDFKHQHTLLATARRWARAGTAVLVILHDLNLACAYADRILLLQSGRLQEIGPPDEVLTPETIQRVFDVQAIRLPRPDGAGWVLHIVDNP